MYINHFTGEIKYLPMVTNNIKADKLPLWKWILELSAGIILFFFLTGLAQCAEGIHSLAARIAVTLFASAAILTLFLLWTRLFEREWRTDLLSKGVFKNLLLGMTTGILFFSAVTAVLLLTGCSRIVYASPAWPYILKNMFSYLLVACSEEVIFRGILFRMTDERYGLWVALGISALVFGAVHMMNPGASLWSSVAIAVEAGVLLGIVYKYSGSLWLPIGLHWAWNFTQGNVFGFPVSGCGLEESIFRTSACGPDIITGGAFGPEASIISVVLGTALSILFIWLYLKGRKVRHSPAMK